MKIIARGGRRQKFVPCQTYATLKKPMGDIFERLWKISLLLVVAIIYLPAFLIVNFGGKTWEKLLKDVGF